MIRTEYLGLAYGLSEIALNLRKRSVRVNAKSHDAGTLRLVWAAIIIGVACSIFVEARVESGRFHNGPAMQAVAFSLLAAGIALRWWAIFVLGRFFTVDVAIHEGHHVVTRGPYAIVRHPSYTGALLAFVGIGLTLGSWPALATLAVFVFAALAVRIRVEERALDTALGDEWRDYAAKTSRLVPFVW